MSNVHIAYRPIVHFLIYNIFWCRLSGISTCTWSPPLNKYALFVSINYFQSTISFDPTFLEQSRCFFIMMKIENLCTVRRQIAVINELIYFFSVTDFVWLDIFYISYNVKLQKQLSFSIVGSDMFLNCLLATEKINQ